MTSQPDEKLSFGEELTLAYAYGKNAVSFLAFSISENAPKWLTKPIGEIINDDRTPAFLFGMGFEAAGLAVQAALGVQIYPILDALTIIVLLGLLLWYQRRKKNGNEQPSD